MSNSAALSNIFAKKILGTNIKNANYTITTLDDVIIANSGVTITLPTIPASEEKNNYWIKNIGSSNVVVTGTGANIEDSSTATISSGSSIHLLYSSPQWYII